MVNLDTAPIQDLWLFWQRHQDGRDYKRFYPRGGKGSKTATKALADYAASKATAMRLREKGEIEEALVYEHICEGIYDRLPIELKW